METLPDKEKFAEETAFSGTCPALEMLRTEGGIPDLVIKVRGGNYFENVLHHLDGWR